MALLMAIKDIFKVSRKTYFSPTTWVGLDEIKRYHRSIMSILKTSFAPAHPTRVETFEEAIKRQHLSEEDLKKTAARYHFYTISFVICAAFSFIASFFYLFHHRTFSGFLLCWVVIALFLAQGFRYSFWRFQIIHRKLGCTFKEWRNGRPDNTAGD